MPFSKLRSRPGAVHILAHQAFPKSATKASEQPLDHKLAHHGPRWLPNDCKIAQESFKTSPQNGPKQPQMAPTWPQSGPNMAQDSPNLAPDGPKKAPRWPKRASSELLQNRALPEAPCAFWLPGLARNRPPRLPNSLWITGWPKMAPK